jgi:hypothetical protein
MKIEFGDGSYLEVTGNGDQVRIVMCGVKSNRELTMSISELDKDQVKKLVEYLSTISV